MTEQNTTENTAEVALEENKLIAERRSKLDKLREGSSSNGHPNDFNREHMAGDLQKEFG
jgi:lysyl-tRNA synthetase class 2